MGISIGKFFHIQSGSGLIDWVGELGRNCSQVPSGWIPTALFTLLKTRGSFKGPFLNSYIFSSPFDNVRNGSALDLMSWHVHPRQNARLVKQTALKASALVALISDKFPDCFEVGSFIKWWKVYDPTSKIKQRWRWNGWWNRFCQRIDSDRGEGSCATWLLPPMSCHLLSISDLECLHR